MRRIINFCLVALLSLNLAHAKNELLSVEHAIMAYDSADYEKAAEQFSILVEQSPRNAELHYNLANAHFKNREYAQAILHYEKAIKLNPGFEDAKHNLEMANAKTIDQIESIPELFLYRWWKSIFSLFSADQWAKLCILFFVFSLIASSAYFFTRQLALRKAGFYTATILVFLAIFSWFMAAQQNAYLNRMDYAIIMEPTVSLNSSPSEGSSKLFVLHEGTKVKIESSGNGWYEVSIPNGNKGWIKEELISGI